MRLLIHDAPSTEVNLGANTEIISDDGTIQSCIGCFCCWVKTPGICVHKDPYQNLGARLGTCDELVIVSRCLYGSYSPFIRNFWDRGVPYVLPYFDIEHGDTRHQPRYPNHMAITVHFYGDDLTADERETATQLVHANARLLHGDVAGVHFHHNIEDVWRIMA